MEPIASTDAGLRRERLASDLVSLGIKLDAALFDTLWHAVEFFAALDNAVDRPPSSRVDRFTQRLDSRIDRFAREAAKLQATVGGSEMFDELRLQPAGQLYVRLHDLLQEIQMLQAALEGSSRSRLKWRKGKEGQTRKGRRPEILTREALAILRMHSPTRESRSVDRQRRGKAMLSGSIYPYLKAVFRAGGRDLPDNEARELVRSVDAEM